MKNENMLEEKKEEQYTPPIIDHTLDLRIDQSRVWRQSALDQLLQDSNSEINNLERTIEQFHTVTTADTVKHICAHSAQTVVAACALNVLTLSVPVYAAVLFAFPEHADYAKAVAIISWLSSCVISQIAVFACSNKPYHYVYETSKERKSRNKCELEEEMAKRKNFLESEREKICKLYDDHEAWLNEDTHRNPNEYHLLSKRLSEVLNAKE